MTRFFFLYFFYILSFNCHPDLVEGSFRIISRFFTHQASTGSAWQHLFWYLVLIPERSFPSTPLRFAQGKLAQDDRKGLFGAWNLALVWSLELGIWNLELGTWSLPQFIFIRFTRYGNNTCRKFSLISASTKSIRN